MGHEILHSEGILHPENYKPILGQCDSSIGTIDSQNIWKDDCIGREEFANQLVNIFSIQDNPVTFALNGEWGSGKTFFLRRLAKMYNVEGGTAVFLNAWSDDELEDPFLPIAHSIWDTVKGKYWRNADRILGVIGNVAHHFVTEKYKAVIREVIDVISEVHPLLKTIVKIGNVAVEKAKTIGTLISEEYSDKTKSKNEFFDLLKKIATANYCSTKKPILFIVDELDRCRPTYAIQVLERVKHLFGAPHLVFLFGVNRTELENSIRSVYGNIDANNYLHRFFDYDIHLPELSRNQFIEMLWQQFDIDGNTQSLVAEKTYLDFKCEDVLRIFNVLAEVFQLSLRELQMVFRLFTACIPRFQKTIPRYRSVLIFTACLKVKNPEMYKRFKTFENQLAELINDVFSHYEIKDDDYALVELIAVLHYLYMKRNAIPEQTRVFEKLFDKKDADSQDKSYLSSNYIADCLKASPEWLDEFKRFPAPPFVVGDADWKVVTTFVNAMSFIY